MKSFEIIKKYTEVIAEYIAKGYVVNTSSYSSSETYCHTELFRNDKYVRIELVRRYHYEDDGDTYTLQINELTLTKPQMIEIHRVDRDGISFPKGEIREIGKWYEIRHNNDWYTDSKEFAKTCHEKARQRSISTNYNSERWGWEQINDIKRLKIALKFVNKKKGCKTVHLEDIQLEKRKNKNVYRIIARNKTFYID